MTNYASRYKERARIIREREESPEGWAAWQRFDAAVERCREIERKYGLKVWAHDLVEKEWPDEYRAVVDEWDAARRERDRLYVYLPSTQREAEVCNGHLFTDETGLHAPRCVLPKGHEGLCSKSPSTLRQAQDKAQRGKE